MSDCTVCVIGYLSMDKVYEVVAKNHGDLGEAATELGCCSTLLRNKLCEAANGSVPKTFKPKKKLSITTPAGLDYDMVDKVMINNSGNIAATARQLNVAPGTIRYWIYGAHDITVRRDMKQIYGLFKVHDINPVVINGTKVKYYNSDTKQLNLPELKQIIGASNMACLTNHKWTNISEARRFNRRCS